jgi:hypothetical protein
MKYQSRMLMAIIALCLLLPSVSSANAKGDNAIFSLAFANLLCAGASYVNGEAISGDSEDYLNISITLYQHFHGTTFENATKHQKSSFKLITSEAAVKAQSLNSIVGARKYVDKALVTTDADRCNQLENISRKLMVKHGVSI